LLKLRPYPDTAIDSATSIGTDKIRPIGMLAREVRIRRVWVFEAS
jgi:hypothetical protein